MTINWEVVIWTCVTLAVIMGVIGLALTFVSSRNMRKRRQTIGDLYTGLRVGNQVIFAGGVYGKVVGIEEDTVNVEVAKGVVVKISRYAIQSILDSNN